MILIRRYSPEDYPALKKLYQATGWFDAQTDAKDRINQQITKDPDAILLAVEDDKMTGSITLLDTGRLALFFRLVAEEKRPEVKIKLLQEGEKIFYKKGYNEAHIICSEEDELRQQEYTSYGFTAGRNYKWFWKKIR